MENAIEVKPVDTKLVNSATEDAQKEQNNYNNIVIASNEQYSDILDKRKQIKKALDTLETERKKITVPIDNAKKAVQELFNKPKKIYAEIIFVIDNKINGYLKEQERIRKEQERKMQEQAEKERLALLKKAEKAQEKGQEQKAENLKELAQTTIAPVIASSVPKVGGVGFRTDWYAEVVNVSEVPREYMEPNQTALNKIATATKGTIKIPGVRFYSKDNIVQRKY